MNDIVYAVVADMKKKEHFVETFLSTESYENRKKQ